MMRAKYCPIFNSYGPSGQLYARRVNMPIFYRVRKYRHTMGFDVDDAIDIYAPHAERHCGINTDAVIISLSLLYLQRRGHYIAVSPAYQRRRHDERQH